VWENFFPHLSYFFKPFQFTIVPDCPSEKVMQLKENKKVKHRTKIIFGTGETLKAITTTANSSFVRAAENQVFREK
jgi:hypothetical protein